MRNGNHRQLPKEERSTIRFPVNLFRHLAAFTGKESEPMRHTTYRDPVGRSSGLAAEMAVYDFNNPDHR